ncbi:MAG: hypothetical protein M3124_08550 [Actinomycetota bacterium]|nr:hypothetical protein [Actinomycetota bacterium]
MAALHIAVVSDDPTIRLEAARAFDGAPPEWRVTIHTTAPPGADVVVLGPDAGGEGIPFDPDNPQRVIDEIESMQSASAGAVIAVTAPSGGLGVTSLALHLAAALAPRCSVGYVDLAGGAGLRMGLEPGGHRTWAEMDDETDSVRLCALPMADGFRALFAPHEGGDGALVVKRARRAFDLVVVDAAIEAAPAVLHDADAAVLVTAPTAPGAHRGAALLEAWPRLDWAPVINRTGPGGETTCSRLAAILQRRVALELPCCAALRDAEDDGRLVSLRWTRYGRAVVRLANALVQDERSAGSAGPQGRRSAGSAGQQGRRSAGSAGPQGRR